MDGMWPKATYEGPLNPLPEEWKCDQAEGAAALIAGGGGGVGGGKVAENKQVCRLDIDTASAFVIVRFC